MCQVHSQEYPWFDLFDSRPMLYCIYLCKGGIVEFSFTYLEPTKAIVKYLIRGLFSFQNK